MSEESAPAVERRRLHPSTVVFLIVRTALNLILPAALVSLSGSDTAWRIVLVVLVSISTVVAVVRYVTLTWGLDASELVVKQGVFHKSERHVPYARIQNLDLVQNVFHRLLRVAEVRIETASGTEPEAVLSVLGMQDVAVLRERLHGARQTSPVAVEGQPPTPVADSARLGEGDVLLRVPPLHLVFLGFVMHRGLAVIGAGIAFLYEFDVLEKLFEWLGIAAWLESLFDRGAVAVLLFLVLAIVLVVAILSVLWSLVRFWGFTLRSQGDELHLTCGLFTRISASIPRPRIQSLTISESWLHRRFGLASIRARTAGGSGQGNEANVARSRIVPVLPADEAPRIIAAAMPHIRMETPDWRSISLKATRRIRRRGLLLLLLPAVGLAVLASPWTLLGAGALGAFIWWWAGEAVKRARFARTAWGLMWQRGVLTRRTTLLPDDKIQTVQLAHSPFDRRHDHVTLRVDAAGWLRGTCEITIRYVDRAQAEPLFAQLSTAAATTEYRTQAIRAPTA